MNEDKDYDVVVDVLTKHKDKLWDMTRRNMQSEYVNMNIMDDIRLGQIEEIKECIAMWTRYKNQKNHDAGYSDILSDGGMDPRN